MDKTSDPEYFNDAVTKDLFQRCRDKRPKQNKQTIGQEEKRRLKREINAMPTHGDSAVFEGRKIVTREVTLNDSGMTFIMSKTKYRALHQEGNGAGDMGVQAASHVSLPTYDQSECRLQHMPDQSFTRLTNINVVNTQPRDLGLLVTPLLGHRTWTTGLFGCFSDVGNCIRVSLCMPCVECNNATRLNECCCTPYCFIEGNVAMRTRLRTLGGISGSIACDACTVLCCGPCAVCQMSREMDNMEIP